MFYRLFYNNGHKQVARRDFGELAEAVAVIMTDKPIHRHRCGQRFLIDNLAIYEVDESKPTLPHRLIITRQFYTDQ